MVNVYKGLNEKLFYSQNYVEKIEFLSIKINLHEINEAAINFSDQIRLYG